MRIIVKGTYFSRYATPPDNEYYINPKLVGESYDRGNKATLIGLRFAKPWQEFM